MSEIINKTKKAVSVPLLRGKTVFLGPGQTGQVAPKALENPKLQALVEDGTIEIVGSQARPDAGSAVGADQRGASSVQRVSSTTRRSGDR